ncbi:TMEM135 C rich domain-containing protein [Citrus sinensis]|uniref:TMEM135 C rich domain-containing protein n=1 Tax=Citrus sinensis TaxID=2711 RepID=A0ACB8KQA0_CITSI|nr:TMEM135 C rich domain-containing protein [Citrus sinensis]
MLPAAGDAAASSVGFCSCFSVENGGSYDDYIDGSGNRGCMHCKRSDPSSSSSCYSCSSLWLDLAPFKDSEKLQRVITASAKGFSIGAGLKGGLALFSILTRLRRRQSSAFSRKIEDFSNKEAITMAIKETIRYGLFLGTFAGPSMLLTGPNTQHTSLAIYILMRAAVLASRSAYLLKQESLPPSYKSFLNKHGGKDAVILQGMKEMASGLPFSNLEAIEKFYKTTGVDIKLDPEMKVPCSIVHGNQGCLTHVVSFFIQAYKRALPVYLPVYLIPALIVHRKGLLERPYTILGKGLLGTARSSLFLSVYCSSAWMWTCFLFRIFEKCNIPMVAMGTFPTGLSLAIEKKSRRMEISLYCLARAIESFCACLTDIGYLPQSKNVKRADVVIFSLSTAIIMHCYAQEREVFRSKYLNVLDWVFGVPPPPCETPRCKSS